MLCLFHFVVYHQKEYQQDYKEFLKNKKEKTKFDMCQIQEDRTITSANFENLLVTFPCQRKTD
jgi:hypothetical protein